MPECTRHYLVPFGEARTAAYFMFGLAEIFDLMEANRWHAAEAQLALLLVAGEHAAVRDWRWNHAWLMTHLPEPPWGQIGRRPPKDQVRPFARLAAPSWTAAVIAYAKDVASLSEAEKRGPPAATPPTSTPKATGKGGQKGTAAAAAPPDA